MHSTPRPILESSICCLGERNLGESPVPIINKSTESLIIKGNKNSFPISVMSIFDTSLDEECAFRMVGPRTKAWRS